MGEDAVAKILGYISRSAGDHASADILEPLDDIAEILRIEPERQRRRRDEVAEKRGQLPALTYLRRAMRLSRPQPDRRHSRSQEPSPLFERQTELAQIGLGQFADLVRTDTVGGEQTVEFAETEPVERGSGAHLAHRAQQVGSRPFRCQSGRKHKATMESCVASRPFAT